jgi:hypothetical protein
MTEHEKAQPGGDNIPQESPGNRATSRDAVLLWTGILAGPFLWFLQQQLCFVLVPWVCDHGGVIWLHTVTLACFVGTVVAGLLAAGYWRREGRRVDATAGQQRVRFMGTLGVFSSLFFVSVIIAQGIPNFLLDPCQR